MRFNLNSWHLLAVIYCFSKQKLSSTTGRCNSFSLAFSPVSRQQYSVCPLYRCRRLHLHISFVFWQRLMCFDAVVSVMWIWIGCVQRLGCQRENDPDWQRDDLSLSPTIPFQISPWITHTYTHPPTSSSSLSDLTQRQSLHFNSFSPGSLTRVQLIGWSFMKAVFPSLEPRTRIWPVQDDAYCYAVCISRNKLHINVYSIHLSLHWGWVQQSAA